jgi:hypothetical protein
MQIKIEFEHSAHGVAQSHVGEDSGGVIKVRDRRFDFPPRYLGTRRLSNDVAAACKGNGKRDKENPSAGVAGGWT